MSDSPANIKSPVVLVNKGDVFFEAHQYTKAIECYLYARELDKTNPAIYLRMGKTFICMKIYDRAEEALRLVLASNESSAEAYALYAQAILLQGRVSQAREILEEILKKDLSVYERYVALQAYSTTLSQLGETEKAIEICEEILETHPEHYSSLITLLSHKKAKDLKEGMLDKYENIAAKIKGLDNYDEDLFYALAMAFNQLGDYKKAAKYSLRANSIHGHKNKFDYVTHKKLADATIEVFNKDFFEQRKDFGDQNTTPIFVIGMPRSSTSLTEQILASHSKVFGCGELYTLGDFEIALSKRLQSTKGYPFCAVDLTKDGSQTLAKEYYQVIEKMGYDIKGKITVDKMPTNFYFLGIAALLFPKAKIINCVRDLRDVAVSNYLHKFNVKNFWAQSFDDIHRKCTLYKSLMEHWNDALPIDIYNIEYNKLLENPEEEIRKLLDYCDLEWQDSCLNFHKTERAVQTASKTQVKQKLFKSSLGKWKNYEPYFGKELRKIGELN
ncbi:MAG: hypothetical protein COV36_05175 [Alphaproteobacteria bacterium CG11_big_fil_rev_8_21_14_0_20_44_7]|nr:MAG: hypothetical protein COV36_05175 [Alphaproteobacteria bacterium CG11_big_fil_rev_8_21_14_0_20_44_7]